jgi:tetratricopeptide (TPR) repeat protein
LFAALYDWGIGMFATSALILLLGLSVAVAQDSALREAERLDAAGKCDEAERFYADALSGSAPSATLLNNLGNHHLVCGHPEKARLYFESLLKIDPAHANANLQLARIATGQKEGAKALEYLARVRDSDPAVSLLRAEASHYAGKHAAALTMLDALEKEANGDPRVLFTLGTTCGRIGLYDRAERAFTAVLAKVPDEFDVLFNLGRAAAWAQHYDRAQRALEVAVRLHPADVDALLELGLVQAALQDYSRAVYLLAQARQGAPKRPDILLALARAAEDAGYYGDSVLTYDEYLELRPADDTARRDRARVCGYTGKRLGEGLKELAWYVQKHPDDPVGYYDLAQFSWNTDPEKALEQLSTAVRLDPGFAPAHYARAWLLHRLGRTSASVPDLQAAVRIDPKNLRALDQLGLTYLALDQAAEAEKVLRRALAISPEDPQVLLHLGRALMSLDREQEAQQFLDQFQKHRPQRVRYPRKEPGMIELATMSSGERARREIERLRLDARSHPSDPDLQLSLARLLLTDGRAREAAAEFRELLTRNADSRIWEQAGKSLLDVGQYELAREFLRRAADERPAARLDLAITLFFTSGPQQALQAIDKVPGEEQAGDYLLMKARILDAAGRVAEAEQVLREGLRLSASRPDVAQQTAVLLLRHGRQTEALDLLGQAAKANPDSSELLLAQTIVLGLVGRTSGAEELLKRIESRWPEWDRAYLVHALLLESSRPAEARQKFQTAAALGSRCARARLGQAGPDAHCECAAGPQGLLMPECE